MRLKIWAERRFTRAGLAVVAGFGISGVMGIDSEHNLEYQAFAVLAVALALALLFALTFRGRFTAARILPRFGTVGVPLHYAVEVKNLSRLPQRGLVALEHLAEPIPSYDEWLAAQFHNQNKMRSFRFEQRHRTSPFRVTPVKEGALPPMAPRETVETLMAITPARRGPLRFKRLLVTRTDPLGLFRAFARVPVAQSVLVLPRRYPLPPVTLPGSLKYQEGGVAMASHVGQSEEFVSLRDYRPGDPLRHIHWRTWARAGKPVVKEFEDEFFVRHALVLDTFTDLHHSEVFEEAVSVAASFACTVQTQESLLDLLFVGTQSYCFTAGRGLAHADQMLEILASVTPSRRPMGELENLVLNHAGHVSGCVCVLIDWDKSRQEFVRKLRVLNLPVLVLVVAPPSAKALDPGPMRDDPEHFHVLYAGDVERGLAMLK